MKIQSVSIKLINNNRFRLPFKDGVDNFLLSSFQQFGILYPLVVSPVQGQFELMDGFKRFDFAKNHYTEIPSVIFPGPVLQVFRFILGEKYARIMQSTVHQLQFIQLAHQCGLSTAAIQSDLLNQLSLPHSSDVVEMATKILQLPPSIIQFCSEKSFSYKQLCLLTLYPKSLITKMVGLSKQIHLTASLFLEFSEYLFDICRSRHQTPATIFKTTEIKSALDQSLSPHQKTQALRPILYQLRFPTLVATQQKIESLVQSLSLPQNVNVEWDKTLENKGLHLHYHIKTVQDSLALGHNQSSIQSILDLF